MGAIKWPTMCPCWFRFYKSTVLSVINYDKGKSAIWIVLNWYGRRRNPGGEQLLSRGFL